MMWSASADLIVPPKSCYQRAIDLLSRRAHFTVELRRKLSERGFEPEEVEPVLEKLSSNGYLNDSETARLWVEQQLARKPQGTLKLLFSLLRKGVDGDLARQAISGQITDDQALAHEAAERWLRRSPNGNAAGLARHLNRLGFRTGTAVGVVQKMRSQMEG